MIQHVTNIQRAKSRVDIASISKVIYYIKNQLMGVGLGYKRKQQQLLKRHKQLNHQIASSYKADKQFFTESLLFNTFIILIDMALVLSLAYELQLETQLFQIILTIFNLTLARKFNQWFMKPKTQLLDIFYVFYFSGAFILTNLAVKWLIGDYHTLTFLLNFVVLAMAIRNFINGRKIYFIGAFVVYFCIFAVLDELLVIDLRIPMLVPLIISAILFMGFLKRIKLSIQKFSFLNDDYRLGIGILYFHFQALTVFSMTGLPLYWAFVSHDMIILSSLVLVCHIAIAIFMVYTFDEQVYCKYFWERDFQVGYKQLTTNSFKSKCSLFDKNRCVLQQTQLCSLCNLVKAVMLAQPCCHMCLCFKCLYNTLKKGWKSCVICRIQNSKYMFVDQSIRRIIGEEIQNDTFEVFLGTQFYSIDEDSQSDGQSIEDITDPETLRYLNQNR